MRKLLLVVGLVQYLFAFSISIDQPSWYIRSFPGTKSKLVVNVRNNNDVPVEIKIYINDWVYTEQGAKKFLAAGSMPDSCAKWLSVPDKLTIPAKSSKPCEIILKTPNSAEGGRQAVVFFETDTGNKTSGIGYGVRLGCVIYQETEGKTKHELTILSQNVSSRNGKLMYQVKIKNNGNAWDSAKLNADLFKGDSMVEKSQTAVLPIMPGQEGLLEGSFNSAEAGMRVLYTLEDHLKNIQTAAIDIKEVEPAYVDKLQDSIDKAAELAEALTLNAAEVEPATTLTLNAYELKYAEKQINIDLRISANGWQRTTPVIKMFGANGKKVKTFTLNEKILKIGQVQQWTLTWPTNQYILPGVYTFVLNVPYAETKNLTSKKKLKIGK